MKVQPLSPLCSKQTMYGARVRCAAAIKIQAAFRGHRCSNSNIQQQLYVAVPHILFYMRLGDECLQYVEAYCKTLTVIFSDSCHRTNSEFSLCCDT